MPGYSDDEFVIHGAQSFGAAIKEFRRRGGLSQAELAKSAGLHRLYLSSLENGLTTETVLRLMGTLKVLGLEVVVRPSRRSKG